MHVNNLERGSMEHLADPAKYLVPGRDRSYFVKKHSDSTKKFSEIDIINMLEFLIDIFVIFGLVFQQTVGIPMGTHVLVCQGMKQTCLYLWYPLFQAQWDRCDQ
jgi:hypothetical protein